MDTSIITEFLAANQQYLPEYLVVLLVVVPLTVWAAVSLWVWKDISNRTRNFPVILAAFLLVAVGNFAGLIVYLLIRPEHTIEETRNLQLFHASVLDKDVTACAECGALVRADYKFCPECSQSLLKKCKKCDARINPFWNYCVNCGESIMKPSWWQLTKEFFSDYVKLILKAIKFVFNVPTYGWHALRKGWEKYVSAIEHLMTSAEEKSKA